MKRLLLALPALFAAACGSGRMPGASGAAAVRASSSRATHAEDGQYVQRNLVSDGFLPAEHIDANLVNAWGITHLPASPWWVSDNGANVSTLYNGDGVAQFGANPLVVHVIGAGGGPADPTGVVANANPASFVVTSGAAHGNARFLFASEDGTLSGWNPGVPAPPPGAISTQTIVAVDESSPDPLGGAVYKGLALAATAAGDRLYATDFRGGRVEVFDATFAPVGSPGAFVDPGIPPGFAPFGIQAAGGAIFVTYAMQDETRHDDVAGKHLGFVSAFTTEGAFLRRVASRGKLNSPWGLAIAPADFGRASGRLLVGNFGDGRVIAYRLDGEDEDGDGGEYLTARGGPLTIDGLWGLGFGNGAAAGPTNALFFAAGPGAEGHGLFGRIDFVPESD